MNAFMDEVKEWVDYDVAAWSLGRVLGLFAADSKLTDIKSVLWTNNAVGNTLYGCLERLAHLGVLERDEEGQRYRAGVPHLHPFDARDDVPSLVAGPSAGAHIKMSLESPEGFWLEADRAGFRHLARVFDEIADSGLDVGWHFHRDQTFKPSSGAPEFSFMLVDAASADTGVKP